MISTSVRVAISSPPSQKPGHPHLVPPASSHHNMLCILYIVPILPHFPLYLVLTIYCTAPFVPTIYSVSASVLRFPCKTTTFCIYPYSTTISSALYLLHTAQPYILYLLLLYYYYFYYMLYLCISTPSPLPPCHYILCMRICIYHYILCHHYILCPMCLPHYILSTCTLLHYYTVALLRLPPPLLAVVLRYCCAVAILPCYSVVLL